METGRPGKIINISSVHEELRFRTLPLTVPAGRCENDDAQLGDQDWNSINQAPERLRLH